MKAATKQLLRTPSTARAFGSEAAIPTALHDLHVSLKGKMVPFAGQTSRKIDHALYHN
jgi:hypothetical protein